MSTPCKTQIPIWPIHRGPTLNDILPKLTNVSYMAIIDASSGYHNLKHKTNSLIPNHSWHVNFTCTDNQFGVAPGGDMLQCKIDEIF